MRRYGYINGGEREKMNAVANEYGLQWLYMNKVKLRGQLAAQTLRDSIDERSAAAFLFITCGRSACTP